jgi:hypothetical protein
MSEHETEVNPSSGCIFCDMDLGRTEDGYHFAAGMQVPCPLVLPEESEEFIALMHQQLDLGLE